MTKEKFKKAIDVIGLPRLIVFCFFMAIVVTAAVNKIDVASYLSSTLKYFGMWGILVLAMIPSIKCGIGPNFGVSLGIVCGLLGSLLAIQFNITPVVNEMMPGFGPWASILFAIVISAVMAWVVGVGYGKLLNLVKGSEMTVTTYIGYSAIYLMCIVWFRAPFNSGEIIWPLGGVGVRNSVSMETSFGGLLNNFLGFTCEWFAPPFSWVMLVIITVWWGNGGNMVIYQSSLASIPEEQYEAASIDGANAVQQFTNITLPYMIFVLTPYIITSFTGNINNFNVIYLLTRGDPLLIGNTAGETDLLVTWLYKLTVDQKNYNMGAVIGIFTFVVLAAVSLITYRSSGSYKDEEAFK